jgi:hypothetical protein
MAWINEEAMSERPNRYVQLIEEIFLKHYQAGATVVVFERSEITEAASKLKVELPKNLGDIPYSFRYRTDLPASITSKAPEGYEWVIRPAGRSRYKFELSTQTAIVPSPMLAEAKVLDATPGVINKYALNDEQALLAKLLLSSSRVLTSAESIRTGRQCRSAWPARAGSNECTSFSPVYPNACSGDATVAGFDRVCLAGA